MTKEQYEKTVYTTYRLPFEAFGNNLTFKENFLSATPVKLFGTIVLVKYRMAKSNYEWSV